MPVTDQTYRGMWLLIYFGLFTKYGRWNSAELAISSMPAYEHRLSDAQLLGILAFIKRSWSVGLRVSQAMLNPGHAGMPPHAADLAWSLPPTTCPGSIGYARGIVQE